MEYIIRTYGVKYDTLFKFIPILPPVFIVCGTIQMVKSNPECFYYILGITLFIILLLLTIVTRKFTIAQNSLKFVFEFGLSLSISYLSIRNVKYTRGVGFRINFTTSFKEPVEIIKVRGMNINIFPADSAHFIDDINKATAEWRGGPF